MPGMLWFTLLTALVNKMESKQFQIEMWDVSEIYPYDKNVKIHTTSQIESLAKVIQSQGWDVPIVVDKNGVIIKGHGRRMAAIFLGLEKVPVICRRDMTEDEVKAARLADNRVALGDFDVDLMKEELATLQESSFDMNALGFDPKELDMMLGDLDKMDESVLTNNSKPDEIVIPTSTSSETAEKEPPKPKQFQIIEVLGFKTMPGIYRESFVKFIKLAEESTGEIGAVAFGKMIDSLIIEMEKPK